MVVEETVMVKVLTPTMAVVGVVVVAMIATAAVVATM